MASSSFGDDFVHFLKQSANRKLKQLKNSQVNLSLAWDLFRNTYSYPSGRSLPMPVKRSNHPCFSGATAVDCGCELHPRLPIPISADFVAHSDVHGINSGFSGLKLSSKELLFTARRREYEQFKFPCHEKVTGPPHQPNRAPPSPIDIFLGLPDNKLLEIKSFREENMKDCMSSINQHVYKRMRMISDNATHRCVHKFGVNERNKLVPLTVNDSGQSTCSECGKPSAYLEQYKGGYPWKNGDLFSTSQNVPVIIIEANDQMGNFPGRRRKKTGKEGCLPKTKDNQAKQARNLVHKKATEIPFSSALIYQKLE